MMLSDPEAIIEQLRKFARKHEAEMARVDNRFRGIW